MPDQRAIEWRREHWEDFEPPGPFSRLFGQLFEVPAVSVEGLDLNRFQRGEVVDPAAIYESGRRFIILEATWGLWVPPSFAEFWPPLLDAGFLLMAYGFFCGDENGADQADLLLNTVAPMYEAQGFWMPLFSDVERFNGDTATVNQRVQNWRDWVNAIRMVVRPGAYSNIPSWQDLMNNEPLPPDCVSWAAHYTSSTSPLLPPTWKKELHQYGVATKYPWCPPVPGMASDVDVDRAYMTLEQLRALGNDAPEPPPEPEEPPMATILENIQQAQSLTAQLAVILDEIEQQAQEEPAPEPPPPPPPSTDVTIRITADPRANARYTRRSNDNGRPIMEIYPSDTAPVSERIQFSLGTQLRAKPGQVTADGGMRYWELTERRGRGGETLFVRQMDAELV